MLNTVYAVVFNTESLTMHPKIQATFLALCVSATAVHAQMYGIMFRTGGQTSGLMPTLFDVNPATGAATNPRSVNVNNCVGITIDPATGVMYGLTDQLGRINNQSGQGGKNLLFTINPATGAATGVGRIDPSGSFQEFEGDIAFNPVDGSMWGVTTQVLQGRLFQINKVTGLATQGAAVLPVIGTDLDISALAFNSSGQMFVLDSRYPNNPGPAILERIDPASGAVLQFWLTSARLGTVAGMTFGPGGELFVADGDTGGTNLLYRFDFGIGDLVAVGPTGATGGIYAGLAGLVAVASRCSADVNADGALDFFDYLDFVSAFSQSAASADFNHDHVIDFFDYLDFVDAFTRGC